MNSNNLRIFNLYKVVEPLTGEVILRSSSFNEAYNKGMKYAVANQCHGLELHKNDIKLCIFM